MDEKQKGLFRWSEQASVYKVSVNLARSCTPIEFRPVPPPSYVYVKFHIYSAFLRAVFLGFAVAEAVVATFLEAVRLIFSLMALRLLALPKEPMVLFPFADFLSPLPMSYV